MAIVASESFSHWDQNDSTVKWPIIYDSTAISVSASFGRNGAGARIESGGSKTGTVAGTNNGSTGAECLCLEKYFSSGSSTWSVGFAIKFADLELGDHFPLFSLLDTSNISVWFGTLYTTQMGIVLDQAQRIRLCRGNPYLDTPNWIGDPSLPIKRGVFYFVEMDTTIGASGSARLRIDGKTIIDLTGINTQYTTSSSAEGVRFFFHKSRINFGNNVRTYYIDDIYINSGGGSFNDSLVEMSLPTGDGDTIQWTPSTGVLNFANVDETSPNENTDYNTASASGNTDVYTFPSIATTAGSVHGVVIQGDIFNAVPDVAEVAGAIKEGGSTNVSTSQQAGTITYKMNPFGFATNPATGLPWTIAEVNSDQYGLRRTS